MHRTFAISIGQRAKSPLDTHLAPVRSPQSARVLRQATIAVMRERNRLLASGRLHPVAGLAGQDRGPR